MVQRPFDSWESRFVKIWTVCNLQDEHDMTVTGRDRHDPRKAILSLVFYTKTKLSIAFGRLGYIYIYWWFQPSFHQFPPIIPWHHDFPPPRLALAVASAFSSSATLLCFLGQGTWMVTSPGKTQKHLIFMVIL